MRPAQHRESHNNIKFKVVFKKAKNLHFKKNLGHLEKTKGNLKIKWVDPVKRKLSWKKGGLAVSKATRGT